MCNDSSIVYIDLECMDGDDEISDYFKTFIEKHNPIKYNTKFITPINGKFGKKTRITFFKAY